MIAVNKTSMVTFAKSLNHMKNASVSDQKLLCYLNSIKGIAEIDRTPCGAGVSERECDELKCCYDPTSTFKCYKPVSLPSFGPINRYLSHIGYMI